MRYVLIPIHGPAHLEAWEAKSPSEQAAERDQTVEWFVRQREAGRIVGGEELPYPTRAWTVRKKGVTDGPFVETKEAIGGFVVVQVESEAEALEMAAEWPGLDWDGDAMEVWYAGPSE